MFRWMHARRAANGEGTKPARIDRREALRIGGMAAVGAAGAAVVAVAAETPADAAAGSKVVLGASNDAGTSVTTLSSATTAETLRVANIANGPRSSASERPRHHSWELLSPEGAAVPSVPLHHDDVRVCIA